MSFKQLGSLVITYNICLSLAVENMLLSRFKVCTVHTFSAHTFDEIYPKMLADGNYDNRRYNLGSCLSDAGKAKI